MADKHFFDVFLRFRNPVKFRLGIVKSQMGIGVQRDADIRVTHDVLQSFRAHAAARHVGVEGMPAYVGCDLWKMRFRLSRRFSLI